MRLITIPSYSGNMLKYRLLAFLGQCDISKPYPEREPITMFQAVIYDSRTNTQIPHTFRHLDGMFVRIQFKGFLKRWEAIEYRIS